MSWLAYIIWLITSTLGLNMFTSKEVSATELFDLAFHFALMELQTQNVFLHTTVILTAYHICIARKGFWKVIVGDTVCSKVS